MLTSLLEEAAPLVSKCMYVRGDEMQGPVQRPAHRSQRVVLVGKLTTTSS